MRVYKIYNLRTTNIFQYQARLLQCSTFNGRSIHERHKYWKLCLGGEAKMAADATFVTVDAALALTHAERIDFLKIDIEGNIS